MKKQLFQRTVCWLLVLCMVLPFVPAADAASVSWEKTELQLRPQRTDRLVRQEETTDRDTNETVRVSIVLEQPSTVQAGYATMGIASNTEAMDYRARLQRTQEQMEKTISARVLGGKPLDVVWNMTLVGNIISAWVPYGKIEAIRTLPGIKTVAEETRYEPCVAERNEGVAPNAYSSGAMIGSGVLWNSGYTGAGSRIAIVDTGTDTDHQSFDNGAYLYALKENAAARGMSLDTYMDSLDLLTEAEIARVLPKLNLHAMAPGVTAGQLYSSEKLAFGYNYVDRNLNIVHDYDYQGEHGSHVAGISTANRYIPSGNGYADARDTVMMLGVAPDAQLITMKVFGSNAPFDSDYMAAIEDAILLDCDVVNLSLGTTVPGTPYTDTYRELMEMMTQTDTVVVISAGNASNWSVASTYGYLYHDDASFDTVGAPGSYASAFTVASVDNDGTIGYYFEAGNRKCFYFENQGYGNPSLLTLDTSADQTGTEYEYVLLDGLGYDSEYDGLNVRGKIVFVSRGELDFAKKANNAAARGAAAVVVYNNTDGLFGMDLTGLYYPIPVVSLLQSDALAIAANSTRISENACTGKLTVYGRMGAGLNNSQYYKMSSFSSWGVPGDLSLKPEITAPGGGIYSLWGSNAVTGGGSDQYEMMSGTSMAAPQVAGMAALLAEVIREKGLAGKTGLSVRHLAQSLLMSTAQPLFEANSGGNYYSLLSQGAGLARVDLAAQAESFIKVHGQEDYKIKAELGDDPERTGIYEFSFDITNLTDRPAAYTLDADLFCQDVFEYQTGSNVWLLDTWTTGLDADVTFHSESMTTGSQRSHDLNGDGVTSAADADFLLEYLMGNEKKLYADADLSGDGRVDSYDAHLLLAGLNGEILALPAGGTATVRVRMALTASAKAKLDEQTPNGTYVEAFVYVSAVSDAEGKTGTTHSIPVLAFYGDWADPTMFDRGTLMELAYMTTDTTPYLYQFIGPYGNALGIDYGDGTEYYYGGNPIVDDGTYLPERNAFNSMDSSRITEQNFTLIRGAGDARIRITNADTGEVYLEKRLGALDPAYYDPNVGQWGNTIQYANLNWSGTDASGRPLAEGTKVNISLTALPHYYRQADGSFSFDDAGKGSTMTTTLTIDNTAPEILQIDSSRIDADRLTVTARDNRHVAAVALMNGAGTRILQAQSPNQTKPGTDVSVELDLSGIYGSSFLVVVYDYAGNMTAYEAKIDLGSPERDYFTAIDRDSNTYVGMDKNGQTSFLSYLDLPVAPRAAEYVGGYVFVIADDNSLWVTCDENLENTRRICRLDPHNELSISGVNDMAYNYADGKLYVQFYSQNNYQQAPYLATLDMYNGALELVCELPVDVNTMAIDDEGNFYSAGYNSNILYTYTLDQVTGGNPSMTYIGGMGYYYSNRLSSMAWDHREDELYWVCANSLLRISTRNAEPTLRGYQQETLVGLYIRPEHDEGMFDPVDTVEKVELNLNQTRVMVGSSYQLEATVWPWNVSDSTVTWTSSDPSVATVDHQGNVTARGTGTCVITATSNLDPRVSAGCTVTTFRMEKTLNGLVWDENGGIWMSEFDLASIPAYKKLSSTSLDKSLASATLGQDGNLYAASLDIANLHSDLYRLDPVTFKPTLIGSSTDGYVDLAPAPGAPGNSLMAVYGGNVLYVDATTGDYYSWHYMFSENLVAIAYVGTMPYQDWGYNTQVDWYFIIDRTGCVYLMGFLEQDGVYYYLEHDYLAPGGVYTKLDFEMDTPYFGSAYFDGEMLYYSAYRESRNNVTLMAIDVAGGSKACYEIGTFGDNIWPVAGLMELEGFENHIGVIMNVEQDLQTMSRPVPAEQQPELKAVRQERVEGTLNSTVSPMSFAEVREELVYVDITLPEDGTNAEQTVSFDASMLELEEVRGNTAAFAWKAEDGKISLALAEAGVISSRQNVVRLTFRPVKSGETDVSVITHVLGEKNTDMTEMLHLTLKVEIPHEHSYTPAVTAPTCTEGGYTTYTCACGHSYVSDYTDALGHDMGSWYTVTEATCAAAGTERRDCSRCDYHEERTTAALDHRYTASVTAPTCTDRGYTTYTCSACGHSYVTDYTDALGHEYADGTCTRCGERHNPFVDVPVGQFYYEPVLWAVENGITNGISANIFDPSGQCTRAQVVTFLWRAAGKPEPASTNNPFVDVPEDQFYYKAVLWAVEKGITNGMDATHFAPDNPCDRAQVVTFLWRAAGWNEPERNDNPFADVPDGQFYHKAVLWAVENGITNGVDPTHFDPSTVCDRAQTVTFLYRTYVD